MASLSSLRGLVYLYLGTPINDPYYPPVTLTSLINEAYLERVMDIRESNPNYLVSAVSLTPTVPGTRLYQMPSDFGRYLDVRITDVNGLALKEYPSEEANGLLGSTGFTLTGVDDSATLTTLPGVDLNATIYLLYAPRAGTLIDDGDIPVLLPREFHTLLAMDAALVSYSLGGEQAVPPVFLQIRQDKEARFWQSISQRGTQPLLSR